MGLMLIISLIILAVFVYAFVYVNRGISRLEMVADIPALEIAELPKVSIIIPALNEENTIEPALVSVLGLDYDNLEIIAVNDRSTDNTGNILEKMRHDHPRLQVIHIDELPGGWLGKNHALMKGAAQAAGEFILFTDADIIFEPSTLKRAMNHVMTNKLDHLSMLFESHITSGLLASMMSEFAGGLLLRFKPWEAKNPESDKYIGVGAFNLVRTKAYKQTGTHQAIAMAVIDDIMLGKLMKRKGFKQDCLMGYGFISVEWYRTAGEMVKGLQKNIFAAHNFSITGVAASSLITLIMGLMPQIAIFFATGPARYVFALIIIFRLWAFVNGAKKYGLKTHWAPWVLVSPVLSLYTTWLAVITTIWNRGISWRGTFYPVEELKKHKF